MPYSNDSKPTSSFSNDSKPSSSFSNDSKPTLSIAAVYGTGKYGQSVYGNTAIVFSNDTKPS